jgi:hypothetical protein
LNFRRCEKIQSPAAKSEKQCATALCLFNFRFFHSPFSFRRSHSDILEHKKLYRLWRKDLASSPASDEGPGSEPVLSTVGAPPITGHRLWARAPLYCERAFITRAPAAVKATAACALVASIYCSYPPLFTRPLPCVVIGRTARRSTPRPSFDQNRCPCFSSWIRSRATSTVAPSSRGRRPESARAFLGGGRKEHSELAPGPMSPGGSRLPRTRECAQKRDL